MEVCHPIIFRVLALASATAGRQCVISVPRGVFVRELLVDEDSRQKRRGALLADLDQPGQSVTVALGGKGGMGRSAKKVGPAFSGWLPATRFLGFLAFWCLVGMSIQSTSSPVLVSLKRSKPYCDARSCWSPSETAPFGGKLLIRVEKRFNLNH